MLYIVELVGKVKTFVSLEIQIRLLQRQMVRGGKL